MSTLLIVVQVAGALWCMGMLLSVMFRMQAPGERNHSAIWVVLGLFLLAIFWVFLAVMSALRMTGAMS